MYIVYCIYVIEFTIYMFQYYHQAMHCCDV